MRRRRPNLFVWAEEFARTADSPDRMHERIQQEQAQIKAELDRLEKNPSSNPEQQMRIDATAHQFRREHRQLALLRQALKKWTEEQER